MVAEPLSHPQDPSGAATPPIPAGSLCLSPAPQPQDNPLAAAAAAAAAAQQTPPTLPAAAALMRASGRFLKKRAGGEGKEEKWGGSAGNLVRPFGTGRIGGSAPAHRDRQSAKGRRVCKLCQSSALVPPDQNKTDWSSAPAVSVRLRLEEGNGHTQEALGRERLGAKLQFCYCSSVTEGKLT